jgi:hypothetical protein
MSYRRVALGEIKFRDAASITSSGRTKGDAQKPVTIGSYYRTLTQARMNVKESLVTVMVGMWLGVVKVDEVRRLFELVATGSGELSEEGQERFVQILEALLNRIVS